jgi:Tfp pilus assembly protein FimT
MKKLPKNKGMSAVELLVVVGVLIIISTIVFPKLSKFHKQQALDNTAEDVVSLLNEARNNTISSKNSTTYGIHFMTDRAILFDGASYVESPNNKSIIFDEYVSIDDDNGIALNGGGDDILFTRLTGDTEDYGTITIELVSDATRQKVVTVNKIGIIGTN